MNIFNVLVGWVCDDSANSIKPIFHLIKTFLNIIRFIVPIALILMTTIDITKKVINPDDKDGQKKIMIRAISALIVFLVPTIVRFLFLVVDWGNGVKSDPRDINSGLTNCYDKA